MHLLFAISLSRIAYLQIPMEMRKHYFSRFFDDFFHRSRHCMIVAVQDTPRIYHQGDIQAEEKLEKNSVFFKAHFDFLSFFLWLRE